MTTPARLLPVFLDADRSYSRAAADPAAALPSIIEAVVAHMHTHFPGNYAADTRAAAAITIAIFASQVSACVLDTAAMPYYAQGQDVARVTKRQLDEAMTAALNIALPVMEAPEPAPDPAEVATAKVVACAGIAA